MTGSPSGSKKKERWFPCDFVCCLELGVKIPVNRCWKEAASLCRVSLKSSRKAEPHFCHIFWSCEKCKSVACVKPSRKTVTVCVCGALILKVSSQDKVRGLCCVLLLCRSAELCDTYIASAKVLSFNISILPFCKLLFCSV